MIGDGLETAWIGQPAAECLVFLHEGLGSITQWRDVPAKITAASGYPAFVYARQGYGTSEPVHVPRPLTYMHDEAYRLPSVLAAAGITKPILIGHSDGASIAIIAAGSGVPVSGLVLIAPHVFVEDVAVDEITAAAEAYRTTDLRARLAKHHADVDGAFWGWNRAWLDPDFRTWNLEQFLPAITVPVLVVQGDADEYGTLAQVAAVTTQLGGPVETLIVPGAGHTPQREPGVCEAIAAFIRALGPRDRSP